MQIFVSYASEHKSTAEPIAFSLRNRGHKVFLDRDDLPAGAGYEDRIHSGIAQSDLFIFLISPESVVKGRFTLTELAWARDKWPKANRNVLPVLIAPTDLAVVPSYLKAVTILEPLGNVAAEVGKAVSELVKPTAPERLVPRVAAACAISGAFAGGLAKVVPGDAQNVIGIILHDPKYAPIYTPVLFAVAFYLAWNKWASFKLNRLWLLLAFVTVGWILAVNIAVNAMNLIGGYVDVPSDLPDSDALQTFKDRLARTNETMGVFRWLTSGFLAGVAGAFFSFLGAWLSFPYSRRDVQRSNAALVIVVGGLAGFFLYPGLSIASWDSYVILFVVWQASVGAMLAFAFSTSDA